MLINETVSRSLLVDPVMSASLVSHQALLFPLALCYVFSENSQNFVLAIIYYKNNFFVLRADSFNQDISVLFECLE